MNCRSFRKFVGAFADGELDTQTNAEALEHLNMCPACAERVAEVHRMREAVGRVLAVETAPPALADRIRVSIRDGQPAKVTGSVGSLRRLFVPLAVAAALVAAVTIWRVGGVGSAQLPGGTKTVVPARFASQARDLHSNCVVHGRDHHDPTLGRKLDGIARELGRRLETAVMAPDVAGFGFDLLGAGACSLMGRSGGHVLYQADNGRQLSIFSVTLPDCASVSFGETVRSGDYDYSVDRREDLSVVAWTHGCDTYVFCSDIPAEELLRIAGSARAERGHLR